MKSEHKRLGAWKAAHLRCIERVGVLMLPHAVGKQRLTGMRRLTSLAREREPACKLIPAESQVQYGRRGQRLFEKQSADADEGEPSLDRESSCQLPCRLSHVISELECSALGKYCLSNRCSCPSGALSFYISPSLPGGPDHPPFPRLARFHQSIKMAEHKTGATISKYLMLRRQRIKV